MSANIDYVYNTEKSTVKEKMAKWISQFITQKTYRVDVFQDRHSNILVKARSRLEAAVKFHTHNNNYEGYIEYIMECAASECDEKFDDNINLTWTKFFQEFDEDLGDNDTAFVEVECFLIE